MPQRNSAQQRQSCWPPGTRLAHATGLKRSSVPCHHPHGRQPATAGQAVVAQPPGCLAQPPATMATAVAVGCLMLVWRTRSPHWCTKAQVRMCKVAVFAVQQTCVGISCRHHNNELRVLTGTRGSHMPAVRFCYATAPLQTCRATSHAPLPAFQPPHMLLHTLLFCRPGVHGCAERGHCSTAAVAVPRR